VITHKLLDKSEVCYWINPTSSWFTSSSLQDHECM